jgi:hypothetical protein
MYPPIHQVWPPFLLSFFLFNMIMHMVLPFLFRVFNCWIIDAGLVCFLVCCCW